MSRAVRGRKLSLLSKPAGLQGAVADEGRALDRALRSRSEDTIDLGRIAEQLLSSLAPLTEGLLDDLDEPRLEVSIARRVDAAFAHAALPLFELSRLEEEFEEAEQAVESAVIVHGRFSENSVVDALVDQRIDIRNAGLGLIDFESLGGPLQVGTVAGCRPGRGLAGLDRRLSWSRL